MTENQTNLPPTKEKQEKALTLFCVRASHNCPQCGHFQGFVTGDKGTLLSGVCTLWNALSSSFLSVFKGFYRRHTGPKPYFDPNFWPILRSKSAEEFSSYFRKSVAVVCVAKRN